MKKIMPIIIAIAVVIIVAGSFYGGMVYAKSQSVRGFNPQSFRTGQGDNRNANGISMGDIIAKDDKSITIKLTNGSSKIIFYSDTTEISKFVSGTTQDLEIGQSINITGAANQDGSLTATTIQIRPVQPK